MSQWGNDSSSQQPPGNVSFFNPNKFQNNVATFPDVPTSQPQTNVKPQPANNFENADVNQTQPANQSAWNSWGGENTNPYNNVVTSQANVAENQQPVSDGSQEFNQQWYGQDQQWNQQQQQWDPNAQQWTQNPYNYQQGVDANQYAGYNNQHWSGGGVNVNGYEDVNTNYQTNNEPIDGQSGQSANYYSQDLNSQFAHAQTNSEAPDLGASGSSTDTSSQQTSGNTDSLNESQSSESQNVSVSQSISNHAENNTDGFCGNGDYVPVSSHVEPHNNVHMVASESGGFNVGVQNSINDNVAVGSNQNAGILVNNEAGVDIVNQMQAVNLQDTGPMSQGLINQGTSNNTDIHNLQTNQRDSTNSQTTGPPVPFIPLQIQQQEAASVFTPPQVEIHQGEVTNNELPVLQNSENKDASKASPPFSDWELVPTEGERAGTAPVHSRNASLDNNVHFFISSTNSSARVSPASSSKAGDEREVSSEQSANRAPNSAGPELAKTGDVNTGPTVPVGPPPPMSTNKGGNPFRKSPLENMRAEHSNESVLSSTHLDVTKPNYENSPVVLNQSISPIPQTHDNQSTHGRHRNSESPDIQMSNKQQHASTTKSVIDTPSRKATVPQSPILMRKESPFQPLDAKKPVTDSRNKPLKASHNIPTVKSQSSEDQNRTGVFDRKEQSGDNRDNERIQGRKTPNLDSASRRTEGRRTPDWDSGSKRLEGRRTPDWDSSKRREGRRTPDWDSSSKRNEGRKTPDWDKSERRRGADRDHERSDRDRNRDGNGDRVSTRPPTGPTNTSNRPPSRQRQSAFHHIQTNRSKNNVSPATSLWDTPDNLPTVSNILLVPAVPSSDQSMSVEPTQGPAMLTPVASLITSLSQQIKTDEGKATNRDTDKRGDKSVSKDRGVDSDGRDKDSSRTRTLDRDRSEPNVRTGYRDRDRDEIRGNRSYESLRDRDRERDRGFKDSRNNSRERLSMYGSRNSLDDEPKDRGRRGDSRERDRSYKDKDDNYDRHRDRDRPPSRSGSTVDGYGRRDYRDRDRDRDHYRRTDKYDTRSRQGDRPSSRQGDTDRPRSRTEHDRDPYYKDKYRGQGYDYDEYYRRGGGASGQYYDKQYYDYYYGNYSQAGGYYDDQGYYHTDPAQQPRYQYDHYQRRSRTGTPGSLSDGGEEIVNIAGKTPDSKSDKKRFDYPPDLHDYSRGGQGYDDYYNYYGYEQNGHRWDPDISAWVATTTDMIPQRQTPEKFMIPHMRACFGPCGQLVKVLPTRPADGQPATVEIHDIQGLLEDSEEGQELQQFPGPLIRGDTHKNDVLLFCQRKARACTENMELEDRESAELIWRFLELLIKQNGTVVGTDIGDLLLQGHEPTTLEYRRTGMRISESTDDLEPEGEESRVSRGTTPVDRSMITKVKPVEEVTDRFRHLLLYGRKKDALDWAMKNNLWGHALFLASKMDSRAHANVMTRFANVAMRMNDPLQTLYQLMSGRQPAAVTCVAEEKWGDWRPHLAMVLSNHTNKPDLDRKCITTLGDTLASKGFLHASHFCYLMSQTSFGSYNKKSSKIVLIGSSHGLPLEYFANNEAVQCTEIYEYALALGNTMINLVNFQYFKYLYATRLADYGFAQDALQYCEVISRNINANPAYYQQVLVKLVYDLSSQLKYSDPSSLDEGEDSSDPDWLRGLHTTLVQFEEGAIQSVSGTVTPAYLAGTTASSDSGEVGMYMQGTDNTQNFTQEGSYITTGGMYSIQEQSHLQPATTGDQSQYQQYNQGAEEVQGQYSSNLGNQTQYVTDQGQVTTATDAYQQQQQGYQQTEQLHWPEQTGGVANQQQFQTELTNQYQPGLANTLTGHHLGAEHHTTGYGANHMAENWSHGNHQQTGFPADVNLGESQASATSQSQESAKRSSLASTSSFSQDGGDDDVVDGDLVPQPSIFDLQPSQQRIVAPRLRPRTTSGSSAGSVGGDTKHSSTTQQKSKSDNKDSLGSTSKPKQGGGIWNKLGGLFSRKNEMKLPDDKEPSIVWDDVRKRWVDKDGGEEEDKPTAPPPKDADLSGGPGAQTMRPPAAPQMHAPAHSVPTFNTTDTPAPLAPSPGGNKFSRKNAKGIGARSQYVDVMNPNSSTSGTVSQQVPSALFNTMPSSHSAPAIFNPTGGSTADLSTSEPSVQKPETIPEEKQHSGTDNSAMTQHNSAGGNQLQFPPLNDNLSHSRASSLGSREVQQILAKRAAPSPQSTPQGVALGPGPPAGQPAMFNPTQFQAGQTFKQPAAPVPGHRLSSRRVYPK